MSKPCDADKGAAGPAETCHSDQPTCCGSSATGAAPAGPLAHFQSMIDVCYDYAVAAKESGRPIVGILCEYTPRELILAAGGVPVCLCGGSAEMIAPAEEHLPANLCPLIKSTFGYHLEKANPFLEMADLVVGETTCDGKKKMYELMVLERPMTVLELPQMPDDPDSFDHWLRELVKLRADLERRFGVTISDQRLREAIGLMNRDRSLRRGLAGLMKADAPPLSGKELLSTNTLIAGIESNLEALAAAAEALEAQPACPQRASRVRVLLTGVPMPHEAERVVNLIEDHGGLIVCMENCSGVKPILDDVDAAADDPLRAIAEKYFHLPCSVMTPNTRRMDLLRELVGEYRPQCLIEVIWQACLTYDVESAHVRRLADEELDLPYLRIETDYSPSDSARIAVRIEALFETVRASQPAGG